MQGGADFGLLLGLWPLAGVVLLILLSVPSRIAQRFPEHLRSRAVLGIQASLFAVATMAILFSRWGVNRFTLGILTVWAASTGWGVAWHIASLRMQESRADGTWTPQMETRCSFGLLLLGLCLAGIGLLAMTRLLS